MGRGWSPHSSGADPTAHRDSMPETGRLALYLLGLRATCPPPDPAPQRFPVTWLKYYLEKDWAGEVPHPQRAPRGCWHCSSAAPGWLC